MNRAEYINGLKTKITDWHDRLSILRDDAERSSEDLKDDYLDMVNGLYRDFEEIESRVAEIDQMSDEAFAEEHEIIDQEVDEFELSLEDARRGIKDV